MKVVVMGAGVIGVTAAYYLMKDGHEVTVIDRHDEAAAETSFANAGLIAPGHSYAWSSPRAPGILLRSLFRNDQALRFKPRFDPGLWRWSLLFLRQCTSERARINTLRKHKLCLYSQAALEALVADTGVHYDGRGGGLLYLYRSQESFERGVAHMRILADDGQTVEVVDRDAVARIDPALEPTKERIAGGLYCPSDGSGDARLFTQGLARVCAETGVRFAYGTTIKRIVAEGDRIEKLDCDGGEVRADSYVLSLGCQSPFLARPLGVKLPIYPIKGYSVTLPMAGSNRAPAIGGVDEDYLVAYCPMGERLRLTATAEFAGYDTGYKPDDYRTMFASARELFPEAADYRSPSYWAGLRPMTPEGTPIFGRGRHHNLIYNTGHGHMGWTMACGSGRIAADLVAGRTPEISLEGMSLR